MKKFLFTLASLVAFGFAASAQPVIALNTTEATMGQENNEVEFYFVLEDFGGATQVKGLQYEMEMRNPNGEVIAAPIHLQFLEKYGNAENWSWFGDVSNPVQAGNSITSTNGGVYADNVTMSDEYGPLMPVMDGVETGSEVVYTGIYKFIEVNTSRGYLWNGRYGTGKNIIAFTVKVDEGWNDEYAELVITKADVSSDWGPASMELQTLRINNADYTPVTPPEPQILTGNIEVSEPTEDGIVYVNYTGNEVVTITVNGEAYNGEEIQLVEGENTLVVVVEAEGYETLTETFVIEWTAPQPPQPEKTEAPVISYELTEDAVIVTAEGAGEVILYCEGQPVENPYTIARGEQDATFVFTATAQEADKEISDVTTLVVTVPAISGEEPPVDPHMEGYWLVVMDKDGNPVWYQMFIGDNGDYTTTIALDYVTYGGYNHDTGERPAIDYYFVIDGVRYGAPEAEVATVLGTALDNALVEGEGFYTLPVGYNYNMGVAISPDGEFFVYAAQAGFVGVDELNANKTVAGVRYFNLAGQEMQEANGMTIVVTTYTDGTTSAVKVMK